MKTPRLSLLRRSAAGLLCAATLAHSAPNTPEGFTLETCGEPVALASAGKALVPIVISPEASDDLKKTAAELAVYLKRITGAEFAIETGTAPKGITLGTLKQFPDSAIASSLGIKELYDGLEAYTIKPGDGRVLLLANTDLGASHAAYRFLELAGCRWFFPGPTWEIVPSQPSLSFNLIETTRPEIWSRDIWFGRTNQKWEPGDPDGTEVFRQWQARNRLGNSLVVNASHRWHAIPADFKEEFEAHPEYFALVDGKRKPPQLCVTNTGLQKIIFQYVNQYFEKNPTADMVSLDPADEAGWCTCDDCKKLGHHSNQAFYLANLAGKELQKTHPGKYIGLLAYSWHSEAPPFVLEPNVYVQLTAGMNASKFTFEELFKLWVEKCSHLGIYEYYSYWEMDRGMFPGQGVSNKIDQLDERMANFYKNKVNSISAQSANCWGVNGLGYYVASKAMWNSQASVDALKKDFYEKAFGPAAAAMERYYERLNLSNKPLPGKSLVRQSADDIDAAIAAAGKNPEVLARLDTLRENLVYNYIGQKAEAEVAEEEKKKLSLEWFTWAYRTRNNYMNDWITFRSAVGRPAAETMGEPTWFWRNTIKNPEANPWRVDKPVTGEELTAMFKQIREDAGELPTAPEEKYSGDFVLVNTGRSGEADRKMIFSGSAAFLVASPNGEPIKIHLIKRDTGAWDKPDTKYWLTTLDGKEVISGQIDTGGMDLELKVPARGVYRFAAKGGGPGFEIALPKDLDNALVFERGGQCRPGFVAQSYFYVPKGAKEINMYTERGGTVTVRDSANKVVQEVKADGKFVSVPVSSGEDGKVWSIAGKFRNLWFFNAPTALSASPSKIFVPRELAKNDGLEVAIP